MIKPKQWLADNGHIDKADINKRGRMSAAHKALIMEAVANGADIEGYAVSKPAVSTVKPTVERVKDTGNVVADIPDMVRDPRDWEAFDDTGKPFAIGIKGVCENCRCSLTYCRCAFPVLRVDYDRVSVVTFKPKKGA
jgi:hypothetical protein